MTLLFHRINTLEALSRVWHKTQAVELDVTAIAGQLVVVHNKDYQIDIATMEHLSWDELQEINPRIPLLTDYIAKAAPAEITMFIEAKGSSVTIASTVAAGIVECVSAAVKKGLFKNTGKTLTPQVVLHGFSIEAMLHAQRTIHENNLPIQIGLGWTSSLAHVHDAATTESAIAHVKKISGLDDAQVAALSPQEWIAQGLQVCRTYGFEIIGTHKDAITPEVVEAAHKAGVQLDAFVATSREDVDRMQKLGVDITTCEPSLYE